MCAGFVVEIQWRSKERFKMENGVAEMSKRLGAAYDIDRRLLLRWG